ncbi:stealth conserved region 3 domain-containing protein [Pantoea sp.]|uniref:stealth conserved region 3 domain-containing protein n=1 Tax=Pantoea sp. TaxID=69393 RepID=UPI00289FC9AF|nr:stealth conserved region 3 domain-containing protein [Pantoea sp.]
MTIFSINKKINKLIKNPNMFFYDYFRKRVFVKAPESTQKVIEKTQIQTTPMLDIMEIHRLGLAEYIKKNLDTGVAPEDGFDNNGLLIWSGYLNGLISFIATLRNMMSMDVTIYTLGGGYSFQASHSEEIDLKNIYNKLANRPDFIIELSNTLGQLHVLHFYLYDINEDGLAILRSSRALIRKVYVNEIKSTFVLDENFRSDKIDAVYTWVNQAETKWQNLWNETFAELEFDPDRFTNNDELKYSLRSLNKYAPWLNKIYIVSNCSKPEWLKNDDTIKWIDHSDIFPSTEMLPTFNSHAIECCLHKIPGLSEKFIYLNDDFILSQPCLPSDFFDETGRSISYFESYGMVNTSSKKTIEKDYLLAAHNSNKLLKTTFPFYNARNLHRHVPYALKKSVLNDIEKKYSDHFLKTRHAKIRSENDINLTSFLYHHFALATGNSVKSDTSGMIVRPENIKTLLSKDTFKYKMLCFNDGDGSSNNADYKKLTIQFFNKRLKEPAPWEDTSYPRLESEVE